MATHNISRIYTDAANVPYKTVLAVPGNSENNYGPTAIVTATTNLLVNWAVTRSTLQSVLLYSDKAITIKTNSSGAPTDTITLAAGVGILWSLVLDGLSLCPFSANVTALYITNVSGGTANVTIRVTENL